MSDIIVHFTHRSEHPRGERIDNPEKSLSQGYIEVYRIDGLWFTYFVSEGGTRRNAGQSSLDDVWAGIEKHIAFGKRFWAEKIAWKEAGDMASRRGEKPVPVVRFQGRHYVAKPGKGDGYGGREFRFVMMDGSIIVSSNVWTSGMIPADLRDQLPDNAVALNYPQLEAAIARQRNV